MAHGSKSKRRYVPRAVSKFGGLSVIGRKYEESHLLPESSVRDAHITPLMSLNAVLTGDGTAEHVGAISLACNVVDALIRQGLIEDGEELAIGIVERCQTALLNADQRVSAGKSWGFSGTEIEHVREMLTMHERMIASATTGQMRTVLRDIKSRIERDDFLQHDLEAA